MKPAAPSDKRKTTQTTAADAAQDPGQALPLPELAGVSPGATAARLRQARLRKGQPEQQEEFVDATTTGDALAVDAFAVTADDSASGAAGSSGASSWTVAQAAPVGAPVATDGGAASASATASTSSAATTAATSGSATSNVAGFWAGGLSAGTIGALALGAVAIGGGSGGSSTPAPGANDAAVIGTPTVAAVTEDTALTNDNLIATGSISISDADNGQASFSTTVTSSAGNLGSLVLAANGSYTYSVANSAVQYLAAGSSKVDTFTVSSVDGTSKTVSFTINGTNDAAVIGTPTVAAVTEDTALTNDNLIATGSISISDADNGQASFSTTVTSSAGNLGSLVLAANGSYTYSVASSAVQYLAAGSTQVDTFTVSSVDGTSKAVSFTINGTNDAAVIGTPTVAAVTEDTALTNDNLIATGSISISDADNGQASFSTTVTSSAGNLGSLVLAANGSYTYSVANSAVQYLAAGSSKVDTFTVSSVDGTSKAVSFTINGTNDAAVIGTPTVAAVTEDTALTNDNLIATGSISISDADNGQASFSTTVTSSAGNLGSLVLAANGSYTYSVASSAVQYLAAGSSKVDTFTVSSVDGTSKTVSFTINGTNDSAVIGTPTVAAVTEDTALTNDNLIATGSISISDADTGQASFSTTVTSSAGNLGSLTLAANGSYTYTVANSAVQYLAAGSTQVDTFTVSSVDGTSKAVSFTINGTNDAAVIGTPTVAAVTEDTALTNDNLIATGSISISDADNGQASFSTTVTSSAGNLGSLTLAANGSYTYTVANSAVQYLAAGSSQVDTFTVSSVDGTSKAVSFTINGTNDAAVIGTPTVAAVTEDTALTNDNLIATGSISISDADNGQASFSTTVTSSAGNLGSLVLAANGSYTYSVANSAVQYLAAGSTQVDTFTVSSVDGTSKAVSFTINGTNDAAVIGTPTVAAVTEDTALTNDNLIATGSISISDADTGQVSFSTTVTSSAGNLGSLVLAANGSYTYSVANSAVQYLAAGSTQVDTFTVSSVDGTSKAVSFTINGTNDAAVIGTPTVAAVTEDTALTNDNLIATGSISISDADTGQVSFSTTVTSSAGNLGSLVLAANGSYTYSVANSAVQYLAAGSTQVDTFTVSSVDGTSKAVSFTINGTNDAAVIGTPTVAAVTEDTALTNDNLIATGSISISDADNGQASFSTTVTSSAGNLGSLVLAANGSYTYSVANSAVQYLAAGSTQVDTFTVSSVDGTSKAVSFTINGSDESVNTAPSFTPTVARSGKAIIPVGTGYDDGRAMTLQADGKILVAGYSDNDGNGDFSLIRLNADGSLDTSFDGDGKAIIPVGTGYDDGRAMTLQADGKILVAGFSGNDGNADFSLIRLNADGSLDTSFDGDGRAIIPVGTSDDFGNAMTLQADGKILVAGYSYNGTNLDFSLIRLNADGSLDTSFDGDGKAIIPVGTSGDVGNAITQQADGKILVAGYSNNGGNYDFSLIRLNTDGSLDTSFDGDGKAIIPVGTSGDAGNAITQQADGKILVAGYSDNDGNGDFSLIRLNADGSLDTSFDGDGKAIIPVGTLDDYGCAMTLQADGKILVAGSSSNGTDDFSLIRLNADGSLDTSFDGDGKAIIPVGTGYDDGRAMTLQADGKILVAGYSNNGGNYDFSLIRLNTDGSLDTSFGAIAGSNTLGGTVNYSENGPAIALDTTVAISDSELSALNSGLGNYSGASVTLARSTGANAQDVFGAIGNLSLTGGNAVLSGTTIGSFTNSGGTLAITFNSSATQARVNEALSSLSYANSSDAPPASVQINWTFNDGNAGAQGSGGALAASGTTTVNITGTNDAAVIGNPTVAAVTEDTALTNDNLIATGSISINVVSDSVVFAGAGDDTLTLASNYMFSALNTAALYGGAGIDTLKLSDAAQPTTATNNWSFDTGQFEIFDMTGAGNNTLVASVQFLLDQGNSTLNLWNLEDGAGKQQFMVKGDNGDTVQLEGGSWSDSGSSATVDGTAFAVWASSGSVVQLLVEQGVTVTPVL